MTALASFDDDGLIALLAYRPDLAHPAPGDLVEVARRAGTWPSVAACYRHLDLWCQQVVQGRLLLPPGTTISALATFLGAGVEAADVEAAVERLVARALGLRHKEAFELVPAFAELAWPARLGPPARHALDAETNGQLVAMARRLGVPPGRTKAGTLTGVAAALSDPLLVLGVVDAGPRGTGELARRVANDGPMVSLPGGLYGPAGSDRTPAGWLLNRGLLVSDGWSTAVMPGEVALTIRGGHPFPEPANRPPPLAPEEVGVERVDASAAETALRLVADLAALVEDWSTTPPRLLKAGGLGVRDLRRAAKALGRDEADTARLVDAAAMAGLVVADLVTDTALPTPAADDWLELDAASRWGQVMVAWLASSLHLGLAGEMGTKDKPIPPLLNRAIEPEAAPRRQAVLSALAEVEPGWAVPARHLGPRMAWQAPALWAGGPGSPETMIEWVVAEAELLGLGAGRALATAGRLAVADQLDEAIAILARHAPPVSATFVVQADLTVVAPGELASAVRVELELLADVESTGAATVYRLSEASLRRGFDAGRSADEITTFLSEHASRPLPQSLTYLVADLGRKFGHLRLAATRCYVRSDDPSLLAEVVRSRRAARLELRLLAPTVAVTDAQADEVLATLRGAGYLPAHEDAAGGLVVTRPERRRAAPRASTASRRWPVDSSPMAELRRRAGMAQPTAPPTDAELATLVGRLRRAPSRAATPPPPPPPPAPPPPAPPLPDLELFDEPDRPMDIAKGSEAVTELLGRAFFEDWPVRIGYTNRNGRSTQLNVAVLALPDTHVPVDVLPEGTQRTLALDRVEWARVMTDAEEEHLYR
ncbi:MAG: helicase-associated domain-containing protein [Acidimicrobiales bacterium]